MKNASCRSSAWGRRRQRRPKRRSRAMTLNRTALAGLFVGAIALQSAWVVYTQTAKPPGPLRIEKVKGDLYMISGEGGNVAVYVTSEGVVLVDDMFDRNHADILAQVKSITDKPLKYVINTHQHDDHAGGDMKMLPIAEVIAHKNARANLVHIRQPYYEDTPGHTDWPAAPHVLGRSVGVSRRQGGPGEILRPRAHERRRDRLLSRPQGRAHRRSVPRPAARTGRRSGAVEARRRQHLRGLRAGRQFLRLDEDARRRADARLRYRDPRTRPGVQQGRRRARSGRTSTPCARVSPAWFGRARRRTTW